MACKHALLFWPCLLLFSLTFWPHFWRSALHWSSMMLLLSTLISWRANSVIQVTSSNLAKRLLAFVPIVLYTPCRTCNLLTSFSLPPSLIGNTEERPCCSVLYFSLLHSSSRTAQIKTKLKPGILSATCLFREWIPASGPELIKLVCYFYLENSYKYRNWGWVRKGLSRYEENETVSTLWEWGGFICF